jgi:hypothetical protein
MERNSGQPQGADGRGGGEMRMAMNHRNESAVCGPRLALSGVEASAARGEHKVLGLRSSVSGQIRSVSCVNGSHSLPCVSGGGLGWGQLRFPSCSGRQQLTVNRQRAQRAITSPLRCLSSKERQVSATRALRCIPGDQRPTLNGQRIERSGRRPQTADRRLSSHSQRSS